jgi:hypothetical protein
MKEMEHPVLEHVRMFREWRMDCIEKQKKKKEEKNLVVFYDMVLSTKKMK